jgi:hypothetical protein
MVNMDCADPPGGGATEGGEKEEDAADGRPPKLRWTVSLKPLID